MIPSRSCRFSSRTCSSTILRRAAIRSPERGMVMAELLFDRSPATGRRGFSLCRAGPHVPPASRRDRPASGRPSRRPDPVDRLTKLLRGRAWRQNGRRRMTKTLWRLAAVLAMALGSAAAQAQVSDDVVKIGVLTDMSGTQSDSTGPGSYLAARMAVEDFGGAVLGKRIEVVAADHQNKPDVGSNIVRQWLETQQVDVVSDV